MSSFLLRVASIPLLLYVLCNTIRGSQYNKKYENTYTSATTTRVFQIITLIWVGRRACMGI
jgi:hypothetical protein